MAACLAFGIDFLEVVDPIPISAVYGMPEMAGMGPERRTKKGLADPEEQAASKHPTRVVTAMARRRTTRD